MTTRLRLVFLLFLLLCLKLASAFEFNVTPSFASVSVGETFAFNLTLRSERDDWISLRVHGIKPWMTIESIGKVEANKTIVRHFYASPFYRTKPGFYRVRIEAYSTVTNESKSAEVTISVVRKAFAEIKELKVLGEPKPLSTITASVVLANPGSVPISDVVASFRFGNVSAVEAEKNVSLTLVAGETKEINASFKLEACKPAGFYCVRVFALHEGEEMDSDVRCFKLREIAIINESEEVKPIFFGEIRKIKVTNLGNGKAKNVTVTRELGLASNFFKAMQPKPSFKDKKVVWVIEEIPPCGSVTISYKIDYLPFFTFVCFVGLVSYFAALKFRAVELNKFVMERKRVRVGSSFRVVLEVRNKSTREISRVMIRDFVPAIFAIRDFVALKPKRKKREDGVELVWQIRRLKPGEERVMSYRLISLVGVKGSVRLPRARLYYKIGEKVKEVLSNVARVGV